MSRGALVVGHDLLEPEAHVLLHLAQQLEALGHAHVIASVGRLADGDGLREMIQRGLVLPERVLEAADPVEARGHGDARGAEPTAPDLELADRDRERLAEPIVRGEPFDHL